MTDLLLGATPSAKFVHYILTQADQPLTSTEIADRSELPDRTVRRALQDLQERDAVKQRGPRPREPGTPLYTVTDDKDTNPPRGERSY